MMRGLSGKRGLISLQKLGFTCIIHQMKDIIFLCLSMYSILRINVKIENGTYLKTLFFHFYFSIVHISTNYGFYMHVTNIHVEGTASQILVFWLSFNFMSKNG